MSHWCSVTLGRLESARIAHSEICEAETDAWDAYAEDCDRRGIDKDLQSTLWHAWDDWHHKRLKALDAVRRAKAQGVADARD